MALPPKSFEAWLTEPVCPNCNKKAAKVPDNQQVKCPCGAEYIVLTATANSSTGAGPVFWTMPVTEFFENIDNLWQSLRESG